MDKILQKFNKNKNIIFYMIVNKYQNYNSLIYILIMLINFLKNTIYK